jgi:hypothetical protein
VGKASERVEVSAVVADVETDMSLVSATVGQKRIEELPSQWQRLDSARNVAAGVTNVRSQQSTTVGGSNRGVRGFGNQLVSNGHSPMRTPTKWTESTRMILPMAQWSLRLQSGVARHCWVAGLYRDQFATGPVGS